MGRYVRYALIALLLCMSGMDCALAAAKHATRVNRTVPKVTPPTPLSFSAEPTDAEFLRTGLFSEPLAPVRATSALENRDLAQTVLAYRDAVRKSGAIDAVEPLLHFLDAHPESAWAPAVQLNLGIIYRQTGHFSKALSIWETGWREAQQLRDPQGVAIANAIVARLSQLEAYLGRKELLQPLLSSIDTRAVGGTAAQLITDSHTGLYEMLNQPEESFRCGPLALKRILTYADSGTHVSPASLRALDEAHSTPNGLSLTAVQEISTRAGMNYQMAFRTRGAAIVMPAVAHWKVGHYAAIVDKVDGRYVIQDTTFGEDVRVSPSTLDEEASGYFLVPAGALPEGWRSVSAEEGKGIWGRGNTGTNHDTNATGCGAGCGSGSGGGGGAGGGGGGGGGVGGGAGAGTGGGTGKDDGGYTTSSVELEVVGLQLYDMPIGYASPVGPLVNFAFYYSHRDTQQPTTFSYTNFGRKWTFNWLSYVTDRVNSNASAVVYLRGGGSEPFSFASGTATTSFAGPFSQTSLTRTVNGSGASTGFTLREPDGSFQEYKQAVGTQFFLTAVGDAAGNKVTLTYDNQMRIAAITDAIGQVTTLTYGLAGKPLVVTQITDPFGRSASFTYNSSGQLASITDTLGITSSYTYGQGSDPDFINTLTTPYGSTTFTYGDSSTDASLGTRRFLRTVDPLNRTSYVEYGQGIDAGDTSGGSMKNPALIPVGIATCNQYLFYRNTFVFDANQYALATQGGGLDYSLAKVYHWLHTGDGGSASRVLESEKEPLENRIWYNYANQPTGTCGSITFPVTVGGAVTNGASSQPIAIARVLDNGNTQLETFQYNASGNVTQFVDPVGRKLTYTYAANGIDRLTLANTTNGTQTLETRTYNSQHLPLTIVGPNGMTVRQQYNAAGQLTRYTDELGRVTTYTYDATGHLKTVQGPTANARYTIAYDEVSRIAAITDPAGSTVRFTYDAADRPVGMTYPDGTTSHIGYHILDVASFTDRLGQITNFSYDAARQLISRSDPLTHVLQLGYNLAGDVTSITDENNHTTTLVLDVQGRQKTKQFADGTSQSIGYENATSRQATLTDAKGQIASYAYNDDDSVASIGYNSTQPTPTVTLSYDPVFPRPVSMVDGTGTTTFSYYPITSSPSLGANMLKSVTSPVAGGSGSDTVVYSYDALNRVVGYTVNGAPRSTAFDELGRVRSTSNPLDAFTYSYADGTTRLSGRSSNNGPTLTMSYFGPQGDELLQQINAVTHGGLPLAQFSYAYDVNYNITSFTSSLPTTHTTTYAYDAANRLKSALTGTGPTPQYAYEYDSALNLTSITANGTTRTFSYTSTNAITSGTYDSNGSVTALDGNSYTWDGENRIVSFSNGTVSSSFTYDGLGRLVRIVDTNNGVVVTDQAYFWCGSMRCLAHDNLLPGSPVSTQYFDEGIIANGTAYYYVQDQLDSVRQLIAADGTVAAQYDYDPYGNRTTLSGTVVADMGYAGLFHHAASGLDFAVFRAYDASHGRWLNRDPIAEAGGVNLYAYVGGNPLSFLDPLGFEQVCITKKMLVTAYDDKGPGSDWKYYKSHPGGVGPNTIAVANTKPPPYPYGTTFDVLNDDGTSAYTGTAHDTGAGWDKKHHNVNAEDWIDIWLPPLDKSKAKNKDDGKKKGKKPKKPKSDAQKWGKQWRDVKICQEKCCK